jgi:hypothetical protein
MADVSEQRTMAAEICRGNPVASRMWVRIFEACIEKVRGLDAGEYDRCRAFADASVIDALERGGQFVGQPPTK